VSCHQVLFLQGKAPKEIHAILTETLGEYAPLYATFKNWVAQVKHGDFSTCDAPRPGRPKTGKQASFPDIFVYFMLIYLNIIKSNCIGKQINVKVY